MADLTPSPFLIGVYFYSYSIFSHFRVIPVAIFLQHFASDRSHMLSEDQKFQAEPPLYECIKTAGMDRHHSHFFFGNAKCQILLLWFRSLLTNFCMKIFIVIEVLVTLD